MTFCTGVARAGVIHPYLGSITSVESTSVVHVAKPGPVAGVNAFTVDDGNLWDAEGAEFRGTFAASSRVDEFNGAGTKVKAQLNESEADEQLRGGVAVGHSTGKPLIYVVGERAKAVTTGLVAVFDEAENLLETWSGSDTAGQSFGEHVAGVAVDDSARPGDWAKGDVYVATDQNIDVFVSESGGKEHAVAEIKGIPTGVGEQFHGDEPVEAFSSLVSIAVDSTNGDVFVADNKNGTPIVDVFEPVGFVGEYRFMRQLTHTSAGPFTDIGAITIDGTDGTVYIVDS